MSDLAFKLSILAMLAVLAIITGVVIDAFGWHEALCWRYPFFSGWAGCD